MSNSIPEGGSQVPQTLGDFIILRRLGRGGMADVYLANQISIGRQVALKMLRQEFVTDDTYLKRFKHEAAAAGGLNHPNIVQVYSVGEVDGRHYIAQEYVQGKTLKEFINQKGPLDPPIALMLMRQIITALELAGEKGIVHRDIKPENILLTRKGEAKVADFGLAQLASNENRVALTQVGVTVGTPLYMSPEQVKGQPLDQRSDLYSFGVVCYHMLAGKAPFQADAAVAVAVKHLHDEPVPLKTVRPDLPEGLCELVHRLMAKKKENRPADATRVLAEVKKLSKALAGKGRDGTATPSIELSTPSAPVAAGPRHFGPFRIPTYLALCALVMLLAGTVSWAARPGDPFQQPAPAAPKVPELASLEAQFFHAMSQPGDEFVWKAIVDRFGVSHSASMEVLHAEKSLALLYLNQDRRPDARRQLEDLRNRGLIQSNPALAAFGAAGLAVLSELEGNVIESRERLHDYQAARQPIPAELERLIRELPKRLDRQR